MKEISFAENSRLGNVGLSLLNIHFLNFSWEVTLFQSYVLGQPNSVKNFWTLIKVFDAIDGAK